MKCPVCKVNIPIIETIEKTYATGDESIIEARVAGRCPTCNKPYIWITAYKFFKEYDLEDDDQARERLFYLDV